MKIIVGLGNPGLRYKSTRHNVGFMVIKVLSEQCGIRLKKKGFGGIYGIGRIKGREAMLFKPATYMNLSGEALYSVFSSKAENKTKDLLVISDDFNLPLGSIRFREKGSAGGHNGLQSIIDRIGPDFARLRVGIGGAALGDMSKYVLAAFPPDERGIIKEAVQNAAMAAEIWLTSSETIKVMKRYDVT